MSLVAAAVSPHPPLLVPAIAGRASVELDDLREALSDALDRIFAASPDLLVVVGSGPSTRVVGPDETGDFSGFGHALRVSLTRVPGPARPTLPLSLTVGAWLLGARAERPEIAGQIVAGDLDPAACAAVGRDLAARAPRVALLVMGDGTACRGEKAPGYADERAPGFDRAATDAFRRGDAAALAAIPVGLAAELLVAGRAPWQVLAGAAGSAPFDAEVLYDAAPYGVQYTVATWIVR